MIATNNIQAALVIVLKAIVNECMDNPPESRHSQDSYLPPHLLSFAKDALACASEQTHPAPDGVSKQAHPAPDGVSKQAHPAPDGVSKQAHPDCTQASVILHSECTRTGVISDADRDQSNTTTPEQLRETIMEMDSLGQSGFGEIAAIAKLALASLATPKGCNDLDTIAIALQSIWGKALDIGNCINATAEGVGCNYVDDAQRRRWDAQREARESAIGGRA